MLDEIVNIYCWCWATLPGVLFRKVFPEPIRTDDYYWTAYNPIFAPKVRLVDGTWSGNGQMWRRRRVSDDRWEYQQDPETLEDQMDRVI